MVSFAWRSFLNRALAKPGCYLPRSCSETSHYPRKEAVRDLASVRARRGLPWRLLGTDFGVDRLFARTRGEVWEAHHDVHRRFYHQFYRAWRPGDARGGSVPAEKTVIVKSDDDVVYLDVAGFPGFVGSAASRASGAVHANIINDGVCAMLQHRHHGAIPTGLLNSVHNTTLDGVPSTALGDVSNATRSGTHNMTLDGDRKEALLQGVPNDLARAGVVASSTTLEHAGDALQGSPWLGRQVHELFLQHPQSFAWGDAEVEGEEEEAFDGDGCAAFADRRCVQYGPRLSSPPAWNSQQHSAETQGAFAEDGSTQHASSSSSSSASSSSRWRGGGSFSRAFFATRLDHWPLIEDLVLLQKPFAGDGRMAKHVP